MKLAVVLAVLALASVAPLPASAQEPAGGHLLTDPKGDVVVETGVPGAASIPAQLGAESDSADLLALDLIEQDDAIELAVQLATMSANAGFEIEIHFGWRDTEYVVEATRSNPTFGNFSQATLVRISDEEGSERVARLPMTIDASKGVATIGVPKVYILDRQERAPSRNDAIDGIFVVAQERTFQFQIMDASPGSLRDQMPDSGEGARFAFQLGDYAQGHVHLAAPDRLRVSNGGATTFVFQTVLSNNASSEEEIELSISDLPDGWNGTVQSPIKVPPNQERTIAVLASVPFEHKHGGFDSFNVTAQSRRDPGSFATVRLGVVHTPVPQPAGHHPELYLHARARSAGPFSSFSFSSPFINTEAAHEGDVETVGPNRDNGEAISWWIPLNPALQMGLDFDLNKTGTMEGSILGRSNAQATLSAKLLLYRESDRGNDDGMLLAEGSGLQVALDMQKATPFKLTLNALPESDYVGYAPHQNVVLVLTLKSDDVNVCCFFGPTEPALETKTFKMALPLNEYHDQLSGFADVSAALDLVAEGPVEKLGRPGNILTYVFNLKNGASREMRVDADVAGNDARLGTLVPDGTLRLDPGETRRLTLAVHIPGDAPEGREVEVLVFAHATDDPSVMAIARTKTVVTLGANATADETDVLLAARNSEADTPGPALALVVATVVAVAIALRRRR